MDSLYEKPSLEKYSDELSETLIYIHIGKCGGATLWNAIERSPLIKQKFGNVEKIHIRKPSYQKNSSYLIVLRNPIDRALSAFNWRYKLVVETKEQESRFDGEYEILKKYETLSNFAENLYVNEALNIAVAKEWQTVHHLKEDINFYLSTLLKHIRPKQIYGVLTQEFLNDDINHLLGVDLIESKHENRSKTPVEKLVLSDIARKNLRRFLEHEYAAIRRLSELYRFNQHSLHTLLR